MVTTEQPQCLETLINFSDFYFPFYNNLTHNDVLDVIPERPVKQNTYGAIDDGISATIPLFFKGNKIKVPAKTERAICRYVSKSLLRSIHPNEDVAIELCLLFLSNLSDTYFRMQNVGFDSDSYELKGWKCLNAQILREQFNPSSQLYKKIVQCLLQGTSKGPIIECDNWDIPGYKSYSFKLAEKYSCKGVVSYTLKTDYVKNLHEKNLSNRIETSLSNPIARNLFLFYKYITLPSIEEVLIEGKRLAGLKAKTKKGKIITLLGKKTKKDWRKPAERSFVEDSIKIFRYLTEDGFMLPTAGGERSGGRVVDSFTLMPGWIRAMCKVSGRPYGEADYSALHPNITMTLYQGTKEFLTHQQVATESGIDEREVKLEHLSFFNKRFEDIKKSPLYRHYEENEPLMMSNVLYEKENSPCGHKATSMRLFKKEVEIMTEVIEELNQQGIYVGYVYDALFCDHRHIEIVRSVMNQIIIKHGVKTIAK